MLAKALNDMSIPMQRALILNHKEFLERWDVVHGGAVEESEASPHECPVDPSSRNKRKSIRLQYCSSVACNAALYSLGENTA